MFHGRTSYGAFSVTDGSSNTRLISGEKSSTPAGARSPASPHLVEQASREAAATRISGDEEAPIRVLVAQRVEDRERIVEGGGVGELRREPVVGDEDLAMRCAGQTRDEERVHVGRRADVAAAVQVQHLQRGVVWRGRNHKPGTPATVSRAMVTCSARTHGGKTAPATVSRVFSMERNSSTGSEVA